MDAEILHDNGDVAAPVGRNTWGGKLSPVVAAALVLVAVGAGWTVTRTVTGAERSASVQGPRSVVTISDEVVDAMGKAVTVEFPEASKNGIESLALGPDGISPAPSAGEAASAYVLAGSESARQVRLFVTTPKGANDAVAECPGYAYRCEANDTSLGVETTDLFIAVRTPELGPDAYRAASGDDIRGDNLANLRVERTVRLYLPEGGYISARETVFGPTTLNFDEVLSNPARLVRTVEDPGLLSAIAQAK